MSVEAPERIWVYHNGNSQTYLTAPNKFHNIEYVLADKLEELAAHSRLQAEDIMALGQMVGKAEAALAGKDKEIAALKHDLDRQISLNSTLINAGGTDG